MTASSDVATSGHAAASRSALAISAILLLVFLACSAVSVALVMNKYPYPSPIDEVQHFDYIHDFPHVPVNGELVSQEGMAEWACRTTGPEHPLPLPACHPGQYQPQDFPGGGYSTAGSTPPVYYGVTAVLARPLVKLTGLSLWNASRAIGALWLTAFMVVVYLLARRLRVPLLPAAATAVFTGLSSGMVASAATLGPDTAAAVTAGLVMLAAVVDDGSRRHLALLLGAVSLAALTKFTTFTGVGAVVIFLLARLVLARDPTRPNVGRSLLAAGASLGLFGVISLLWGMRFQNTSLIDPDEVPINQMLHADSVDWSSIRELLLYVFVSPATGNWSPGFINDATNNFLVTVMAGLFAVGTLTAALALRNFPRVSALGIGLVTMAVVSPFVLVALNLYANHLYFLLSPRYGYGLLPGIAAATAWAFRAPAHARAILLLAALSLVNLLT